MGDGGARRDGWTLVGRGRERLTYTRGARRDVVEDAMVALRTALVVTYTAVLGSLGIVLCLLVPGGAALMPLARLWSRLVLRTYRVRYRASFPPAFDSSCPSVYMANHESLFDIPALVLAMPSDFRMVAKRELLLIPIFGWALWLAGFIFIDRSDREKAIRKLDRTVGLIRRGRSVVVFAEGTRSADGRLLPFKKGGFVLALQAGVPIVPVAIRGGREVLPKGSLRARPGTIEVVFRTPVPTTTYSLHSKEALIAAVRERIVAGLKPPRAEFN